jgi:hypothetical protein
MARHLWSWWKSVFAPRRSPRRAARSREWLRLEALEDRTLLSGNLPSTALHFTAFNTAHAAGFLASPNQFDLFRLNLNAGGRISAAVTAQMSGSGLQSILRVFDATGTPQALDDQEGGDPRLTFQAATAGTYYIGVSAQGNDTYDPATPSGGQNGSSHGLFSLDVTLTPRAPLRADLAGASFRLTSDTAVIAGGSVAGTFAIDNRGGAAAGTFDVQVVASTNNSFDTANTKVLTTFTVSNLGAGQEQSVSFAATLPTPLPTGPFFVGLRIDPTNTVPELNPYDQSGVHRGEDWEQVTIVTRAAVNPAVLSTVDPNLNTTESGFIRRGLTITYPFTVTGALGSGRLTADVAPLASSGPVLQLALNGPNGELLIQSDSGEIVQNLTPGTYSLSVTTLFGIGAYRLTTQFVRATAPSVPIPTTPLGGALGVVSADLNGDGVPDLIVNGGNSVGILLGNGDGTFQPPQPIFLSHRATAIAVADVNGDGRPDVVVAYGVYMSDPNRLIVLLGNGDGTFQLPAPGQQTFGVGSNPTAIAIADLTGDGKADLVVRNAGDATVSVLLGNGDGTFAAQQTFAIGQGPYANSLTVADLNGDGRPDILAANPLDGTVSILLNQTTRDARSVGFLSAPLVIGGAPVSVTVGDFNRDGKPDLAVANAADITVSVLAGDGTGAFTPLQTIRVANGLGVITTADVNGDGRLDLLLTNEGDRDFSGNTVSELLGRGNGTFQASQFFNVESGPIGIVVVDVNGDGNPDLITANAKDVSVSVLAGRGDGTFEESNALAVNSIPSGIKAVDLNGDGKPDLVVTNFNSNSLSVLMGNGDGTFQSQLTLATRVKPYAVVVADLNSDGRPDLVVANRESNSVSVFLGNGDGTFQQQRTFAVGNGPVALFAADVNGDGVNDIIVANRYSNSVSVLLGSGDGTFSPDPLSSPGLPPGQFLVGSLPHAVYVADINGDGTPDLVAANASDGTVSILLGDGQGAFAPQQTFAVGASPQDVAAVDLNGDGRSDLPDLVVVDASGFVDVRLNTTVVGSSTLSFGTMSTFAIGPEPDALVVADLNGDGMPDVAVANQQSEFVSVLLEQKTSGGKPIFQAQITFATGNGPNELAVADVNGDGNPDLVTANAYDNTISVLLGGAAGTFLPARRVYAGYSVRAETTADVNGDGIPDLVVVNGAGANGGNTVSVLLGKGDGTFQSPLTFAVGSDPVAVAVADLDGDRKLDLVVANADDTVSVLLGNGNGTFQPQQTFSVGQISRGPESLLLAKVNGDGSPDIVVANYGDNTIGILINNGDGTFQPQQTFAAGIGPYAIAAADVNGDGAVDVVATGPAQNKISVLLGDGRGTFGSPTTIAVGLQPRGVAIGDLNGDGKPDLAVAYSGENTVGVLIGNGLGQFHSSRKLAADQDPRSVAIADVSGDGKPDVIAANYFSDTVSVFVGDSQGNFQPEQSFPVGFGPRTLSITDVNKDGRNDILTANSYDGTTSVLLGTPGTFSPTTPASAPGPLNEPILANLTGHPDGTLDSVIVDRAGRILFRLGLPGGEFASPLVINSVALSGQDRAARDIAIVNTGNGLAIAAADEQPVQGLYTISLYTLKLVGGKVVVSRTTIFSSELVPTRVIAGDLTVNSSDDTGLDDLVIANSLDNSVTIVFQTSPGVFDRALTRPVGIAPSDLALADVAGNGQLDVVVADQASGDVSVLYNGVGHLFQTIGRFRTDTGPYGIDPTQAQLGTSSLAAPVSLALNDFTGNGLNDLVVVNRGAHTLSVLQNEGLGGFLNPEAAMTTSTSVGAQVPEQAGPLVTGDFNRDGTADVAVLMQDLGQVWIFTGNGDGTFKRTFVIAAGDQPTGIAEIVNAQTGFIDLLVGDQFGDILRLEGNGDGTFRPGVSGDHTSLSAQVFTGTDPTVVVADQADNLVNIQNAATSGPGFVPVSNVAPADTSITQLAPGAVQWIKLEGTSSPFFDAVVLASGSNSVLVYHTIGLKNGVPVLSPPSSPIFVGDDPVGLTVAFLNGSVPDMIVANKDSNDVSVIFGKIVNGLWVGTAGPRLHSGGSGPVATSLLQVAGHQFPDLVIYNSDGTIAVLPGRGLGFFDDRAPSIRTITVPDGTGLGAPSFAPNSNIGLATTGAGDIVAIDLDTLTTSVVFVPGAGETVNAVEELANGLAVAALSNGTVAELFGNSAGQFTEAASFTALTGSLTDASELQVVDSSSGLQVLVTNTGSDELFVFAFSSFVSTGTGNPVGLEVTPATESSLTLILTLLAGNESTVSAEANATGAESETVESTVSNLTTVAQGAASGGDDSTDADTGPLAALGNPAGPGTDYYDQKLRRSDVIPSGEDDDTDTTTQSDLPWAAPTELFADGRAAVDELFCSWPTESPTSHLFETSVPTIAAREATPPPVAASAFAAPARPTVATETPGSPVVTTVAPPAILHAFADAHTIGEEALPALPNQDWQTGDACVAAFAFAGLLSRAPNVLIRDEPSTPFRSIPQRSRRDDR